jgi:hypothetical protein
VVGGHCVLSREKEIRQPTNVPSKVWFPRTLKFSSRAQCGWRVKLRHRRLSRSISRRHRRENSICGSRERVGGPNCSVDIATVRTIPPLAPAGPAPIASEDCRQQNDGSISLISLLSLMPQSSVTACAVRGV